MMPPVFGLPSTVESFLGKVLLFEQLKLRHEAHGLLWPSLEEQWETFERMRLQAYHARQDSVALARGLRGELEMLLDLAGWPSLPRISDLIGLLDEMEGR